MCSVRVLVAGSAQLLPRLTTRPTKRASVGGSKDFGVIVLSFSGPTIDAVRFEEPWPRARFREDRHFMDVKMGFRPNFRLP